jgi:tRNA(fMet)-specific endonuclease VapC
VKRYLLDTNIVSYFLKGIHPGLHGRMRLALQAQDIAISAITRAELRYGQNLMAAGDKRRTRIDLLLADLPVMPWNTAAADIYGEIGALLRRQGTPIGEMATQIAAHALAENLILVTHNTRHFEKVPGLKLEDWMV